METLVEKLKRIVEKNFNGEIEFTTKGNEPVLAPETIIIGEFGVTRLAGDDHMELELAWDEMTDEDAEPVFDSVMELLTDKHDKNIDLMCNSLKNEVIRGILALLEKDKVEDKLDICTGYGTEIYKTIAPEFDDNGDIVSAAVLLEYLDDDEEYVEEEFSIHTLGISELLVIYDALK